MHALEREMQFAPPGEASEGRTTRTLSTIYLGGGTPSQLGEANLRRLFSSIREHYAILPDAEITVEVNPDDVTPALVCALRDCGGNRVSMGVQSFLDSELQQINRRHTAEQAKNAVMMLHDGGITNLSIDLIYGLPGQTLQSFSESIEAALRLPVTHISSYALSIEEGTALWRLREAGRLQEADEELMLAMYNFLRERLLAAGFEHYEISNFALPGYASRHNSSYWQGKSYIGLGPGAHGYDGLRTRYHNADDLLAYVKSFGCDDSAVSLDGNSAANTIKESAPQRITEVLTDKELYDELVFTRLRCASGLRLEEVPQERQSYLLQMAEPHLKAERLVLSEGVLRLTPAGLFVSDDVMSDLFVA